jgi:putative phosphoesterase
VEKTLPLFGKRVKEEQLVHCFAVSHVFFYAGDGMQPDQPYPSIFMRIAVLSDSHDHIPHLRRAVLGANQEGAELLIHCGDLISPFMLTYLESFNGQAHLIYGNNAGDQHLISSRCASPDSRIQHHGTHGTLVAGGLRIAIEHYPKWARQLACSGDFDLVCCGHNHIFDAERLGNCLLLNPGDLLGKDAVPAFALFDTDDFSVRRIEVGEKLVLDD